MSPRSGTTRRGVVLGAGGTLGAAWMIARLRALEDENRRLKKLLAESMLDVSALKDLLGKN